MYVFHVNLTVLFKVIKSKKNNMDNDICTPKMKGYSEEKEVGKEKDGVEQSSTRSRSGVLISLKAYFKAKKKKKEEPS